MVPRPGIFAIAGLVVAVTAARAGDAQAEAPRGSSIDLDEAASLFAAAEALSLADDGELWGRQLYGPTLFVEPASRAVVANAPDGDGILARAKRDGADEGSRDLYTGTLPETIQLANTSVRWAGKRWSMILWPVAPVTEGDSTWTGSLLVHESFHRIQPDLGISLAVVENAHLDGAMGRTWMRLEWRALAAALDADDPLVSESVRDALLFRAWRRHHAGAGAAEEERLLELNEGLAEYTGLRLGGATPEAQLARAIAGLARAELAPSFVRSFAYASGPPYGLLLDRARPGWTRRTRGASDLGAMLAKAIRCRLPRADRLEAEAHDRALEYGLEALRHEETARAEERIGRIVELRARFVEGPVLVLALTGETRWSFSTHDAVPIDGVGNVYARVRLSAAWGILDAPGGAIIIEGERGTRRAQVPASATMAEHDRAGDGWTLELNEGWRIVPGKRAGDWRVDR